MDLLTKQTKVDLEPYNYIFEKATYFLDKDVYNTNINKLNQILNEF